MRPLFGIAIALLSLAIAVAAYAAAPGRAFYGFDQAGTARELALEQRFAALPSAQGAAASLRALTAYSRYDGSWGDGESANWMLERLTALGWQAHLAPFMAPLERPKRLELELLAPKRERFDLHESTGPGGPPAAGADAGVPFDYGSPDGNVRAPLIYANYGRPDDYGYLRHAGIDLRGAVV
ncbi:MAG: hypothetical protein KGM44_03125, partial [bacterium]|nr:hypothetical protein [bacterium]